MISRGVMGTLKNICDSMMKWTLGKKSHTVVMKRCSQIKGDPNNNFDLQVHESMACLLRHSHYINNCNR